MRLTDQTGFSFELNERPKKIISVVPSQTELLFDLGLEEEVIGLTKFCIHPDQWYRTKDRIGGTKNLDLEKIKKLQPDLIIANKEENDKGQIELLRNEFPVWTSDISDLSSALSMISEVGKIVERTTEAEALIRKIEQAFNDFKPARSISCLYLIWNNPMMFAGRSTFIDAMLQHSGFQNCMTSERYPQASPDELKSLKPEVIMLSSEPYPFKEKDILKYQQLFPNSVVIKVDGEMFSWYGSRLLSAPAYFSSLRQKIKNAL